MNLDRFSQPLAGEREQRLLHYCDSCNQALYEGEEVVTWDEDEFFCDFDCFKEYMNVREVYLGDE